MPKEVLTHVSRLLAVHAGLRIGERDYPRVRQALIEVTRELNLPGVSHLAWVRKDGTPAEREIQLLASKLAIGETYFMREPERLRAMCAMLHSRTAPGNPIRVWSAGCSSGEEAYSIAIILLQRLRARASQIQVVGTDIHEQRLAKAQRGVYTRWSFRNPPAGFQSTYFAPTRDGQFTVRPEIRAMVSFHALNHMAQPLPSTCFGGELVDAVVCRNVLMYMTDDAVAQTLAHFTRRLKPGGLLIVSPAEVPLVHHPDFTRSSENTCIFTKYALTRPEIAAESRLAASGISAARAAFPRAGVPNADVLVPTRPTAKPVAGNVDDLSPPPVPADVTAILAPSQLGLGERMDPTSHYMRGCMLKEQGELTHACRAFANAIYVQFDYPAAHFQLGLALRELRHTAASRTYLQNAERLLRMRQPNSVVDELAGLTAGRLADLAKRMAPEDERDA